MSDLTKLRQLAMTALDRFRLDGKSAVVLGGSQVLGKGMSLVMLRQAHT
jgi:5,10-methylene-tetrahydrofolate dehydrogenase/methenyl tetrahydrofolate cyclohydrolase